MRVPSKTFAAFLISASVVQSASAQSSAKIPVRSVAKFVIASDTLIGQPIVRHLKNGSVLVNDAAGKRVVVYDSTLARFSVSADANGQSASLYPSTAIRFPFVPYGDSTLFVDLQAQSFMVVNAEGKMMNAIAHPRPNDLANLTSGTAGVDSRGRLIYRGASTASRTGPSDTTNRATFDTAGIVRADFDTRSVDTIAHFRTPRSPSNFTATDPNGKPVARRVINPVQPAPDSWTVMTDGTVAVVRGHDYHVDWFADNGSKASSAKLPFDWKPLSDVDKQARIDSMKKVIDSVNASGQRYGMAIRVMRLTDGSSKRDTIIPQISFVPISEIADYYPPIRENSARADDDNNLWILPATSAQVGPGLLYDVVNRKGELFERVRLPENSVLVGFGKGGIIYFARSAGGQNRWILGRGRISTTAQTQ